MNYLSKEYSGIIDVWTLMNLIVIFTIKVNASTSQRIITRKLLLLPFFSFSILNMCTEKPLDMYVHVTNNDRVAHLCIQKL